jgi:hypothetical protein
MDPTTVLQRLPLAPAVLRDLVKVVFITKKKIAKADISRMRFCFVWRKVIHNMLTWFIENNPLYADVDLDLESLALYPEEGIVPDILNSVIFCDKVDEDKMAHSSYDREDDDEGLSCNIEILIYIDSDVEETEELSNSVRGNYRKTDADTGTNSRNSQ